jgi:hypothetical protein
LTGWYKYTAEFGGFVALSFFHPVFGYGIKQVKDLGFFRGLMTTISDSFYQMKRVRLMVGIHTLGVWTF